MALEAVIGVLGVFVKFRCFGGGVISSWLSLRLSGGGKELMRWAVGVLSGCKLSGGRRNGCKDFLFTTDDAGWV